MTKSEMKKLKRTYKNDLKQIVKYMDKNLDHALGYLYNSLLYRRDVLLLEKKDITTKDIDLEILNAAIKEFESYLACEKQYFKMENGVVSSLNPKDTPEEALKKYNAERRKHWLSFWGYLADGMEGWLAYTNVTI